MQAAPDTPFDVPRWTSAKVHADHHVQVERALYSAPTALLHKTVDVRIDKATVRIYFGNELIKIHLCKPPGKRSSCTSQMRDAASLKVPPRRVLTCVPMRPLKGRTQKHRETPASRVRDARDARGRIEKSRCVPCVYRGIGTRDAPSLSARGALSGRPPKREAPRLLKCRRSGR